MALTLFRSSEDEVLLSRKTNGKRAQIGNGGASSDDDDRPLVSCLACIASQLHEGRLISACLLVYRDAGPTLVVF